MYSGTMIEDLIKTVQHAEQASREQRTAQTVRRPAPRMELQAFFYQMQRTTHIHVGVA